MSHSNLIVIRTKSPLLRFSDLQIARFGKIRLKEFSFDESGLQNFPSRSKNSGRMPFYFNFSPRCSDRAIGLDEEG